MKKSLIAASAASVALAAMPVVGVFAAKTPAGSVTDTLTVNIPASCTIRNANSGDGGGSGSQTNPALTNAYAVTMTNGELRQNIGSSAADDDPDVTGESTDTITVSCNTEGDSTSGTSNPAYWLLTAAGAGTGTNGNELVGINGTSGSIATGTAVSGATSNWAFKVVKNDTASNVSYEAAYTEGTPIYTAVPATSSEMNIAHGVGTYSGGFDITYQVYISPTQATGTYQGKVKYTLYNPAA